ncbi:MAG: ribosome recycling factor [Mycoplasmataceae bacterium]|nr:ribosome recycling factor [Mycoplasmataceae bacterium]
MEWNLLQKEFETQANAVIDWLNREFTRIKSGRVSLNILDTVKVVSYGEPLSLNQVANLQIIDARQILIKPYDPNQTQDIAKAIATSQLNLNPQINSDNIRLIFPTQTEENRKENVKKAKEVIEQAKQKIRDVRKHVQNKYKNLDKVSDDLIRYFEDELNKITKVYNGKLENLFTHKEQELMKV